MQTHFVYQVLCLVLHLSPHSLSFHEAGTVPPVCRWRFRVLQTLSSLYLDFAGTCQRLLCYYKHPPGCFGSWLDPSCASWEVHLAKFKMQSFLFHKTCVVSSCPLVCVFLCQSVKCLVPVFHSDQLMMAACEWYDVPCRHTGALYTVSYWIDVPESKNAHRPGFCPEQGHTQHPLPHAAPCSVRIK